jgi:uncharacterized membrane protein YgaE (UPF0421/DUF939 family)
VTLSKLRVGLSALSLRCTTRISPAIPHANFTSKPSANQSNTLTKQSTPLTKQSNTLTNQSNTLTKQSRPLTNQSNTLTKQSRPLTNQSNKLTKESNTLTNQSKPSENHDILIRKSYKLPISKKLLLLPPTTYLKTKKNIIFL